MMIRNNEKMKFATNIKNRSYIYKKIKNYQKKLRTFCVFFHIISAKNKGSYLKSERLEDLDLLSGGTGGLVWL